MLGWGLTVASGFEYELRECDKEDLEEKIIEANNDDKVDGIMVYFPVFGDRHVTSPSSRFCTLSY